MDHITKAADAGASRPNVWSSGRGSCDLLHGSEPRRAPTASLAVTGPGMMGAA